MLTLFLIAYLAILLVTALPRWQYSRGWGYYPCWAIMVALGSVIGVSAIA